MKILFPFVGDSIGGSHVSTFTLLDCLKAEYTDIKVDVLVFSASDDFKKYASMHDIHFRELGLELNKYSKFNIIFDILRSLYLTIRYLSRESIDVVHTNDLRMNLIFLVASKFVFTKHLWHQRTSMPRSSFGQRVYLLCDKFVVISNFILNQIHDSIPLSKISMVYNPVESYSASSNELLVRKEFFVKKKHTLAYIANMTQQKKPEFFVELAKYITKNQSNKYQFIMVGRVSDSIKKTVNEYKKCGNLDSTFKMVGFQYSVEKYWPNIDFLIVPAIRDGFGRTIVEAMRAGVVVIASNSGGHKEIIQDGYNGFLVKQLNEELFASKLFIFENNVNKYMEVLLNAHKDTSSKYSVKNHTSKIHSIYHSMIQID